MSAAEEIAWSTRGVRLSMQRAPGSHRTGLTASLLLFSALGHTLGLEKLWRGLLWNGNTVPLTLSKAAA